MKGPSIAVMLGGKGDDAKDDGDLSLSEAKARAEDAATAFASAVKSGDAKKIVKSFHALGELCGHVSELEESGETEDDSYGDSGGDKEEEDDSGED